MPRSVDSLPIDTYVYIYACVKMIVCLLVNSLFIIFDLISHMDFWLNYMLNAYGSTRAILNRIKAAVGQLH